MTNDECQMTNDQCETRPHGHLHVNWSSRGAPAAFGDDRRGDDDDEADENPGYGLYQADGEVLSGLGQGFDRVAKAARDSLAELGSLGRHVVFLFAGANGDGGHRGAIGEVAEAAFHPLGFAADAGQLGFDLEHFLDLAGIFFEQLEDALLQPPCRGDPGLQIDELLGHFLRPLRAMLRDAERR